MKQRAREAGIALGVWLVGAAVFFRPVWKSGFDRMNGDEGDARLVVYLHEHWMKVLSGDAAWRTPEFFHPAAGTLGFADTFLLDVLLYAPLRAVGCDQFLALQLTLIALSGIGFGGCYLLCTRLLATPRVYALALSLTFAFANNLAVQVVHPQLAGVHWLPWIALLAAKASRAPRARVSVAYAIGAGLLLGALLYSTYYVGWFAILTAGILGTVFIAQRPRVDKGWWSATWRLWLGGTAGFAIWLVPFAATYLPTLRSTGGRPRYEVVGRLPGVRDLVNYGRSNVWSWLSRQVTGDPERLRQIEQACALTPLLTATLAGCAVMLFKRTRGDRTVRTSLTRAFLATSLMLYLLPVRLAGHSLWEAIWFVVPGAKAIRAADRIEVINSLLAVIAIAASISVLRTSREGTPGPARWGRLALPGLLLLIAIEQTNTGPIAAVDRPTEVNRIGEIPRQPDECESFLILPQPDRLDFAQSIDAMLVSHAVGLPTLNGYSGSAPPGWTLTTANPLYLDHAQAWAETHHLTGVCGYDPVANEWTVDPFG